jgi:hypothetical protein
MFYPQNKLCQILLLLNLYTIQVIATSHNMSVKNNLQPKIENFNNNIHTNHLDSINGVHIFNYDSVIHRHGMKHPRIVQQPMIIITLVI